MKKCAIILLVLVLIPPLPSLAEDLAASLEGVSFEAAPSAESNRLILKGTKTLTFRNYSVEGSVEGFPEGSTLSRDESLKLNISGRAADTDIDATIINTSSTGMNIESEQEDKVSILLRRGSTEAYFGDFTANFDDTEFARLSKELSGLRVSGDYSAWTFKAIASSPKGESKNVKLYGDGTQGPYALGISPVVVNSEHVMVDGVGQRRGEDYDIDYEGGTITFRKRTIIATSVIEADFDFRDTPYEHTTYGLRLTGNVSDNMRLGATYINDSDSLNGAREERASMTINPVDPISHYLIGVDTDYTLGPQLKLNSEFAYSDRNSNLLSTRTEETISRDSAFKISSASVFGPLSFDARFKRIGPAFSSIADALPREDLWGLGSDFTYKPDGVIYSDGAYNNESYDQGGVRYKNSLIGSKTKLAPAGLPTLAYSYNELRESNDPVSTDRIDRSTVTNAVESTYQWGFINNVVDLSNERRLYTFPSEEAVNYRVAGYGVSTVGFDKFSASGNLELKETDDPFEGDTSTKTYVLDLSASPAREYFASASLNTIDDSKQGITTVTDLGYKANPIREINAEGKFTVMTLKEDFGLTPEVVSKQVGSFRIDLRPIPELRLRHTYRPNFEIIPAAGLLSYQNNSNQSEITWSPLREISTGVVYKVDTLYSLDTSALYLDRRDEESDNKTTTFTIKAAPIRIMSIELNYTYADLFDSFLTSSSEPTSYTDITGSDKNFGAALRTSLSEQFSLDSGYSNEKIVKISNVAEDAVDELVQTGTVKGTWNLNDEWSVYMTGSYCETTDNLASEEGYSYSIAPGAGFIFRITNLLRLEASYSYSRSYAGSSAEKTTYTLDAKYDMNEYVHMTLSFDEERNVEPYYKITDLVGNVEIDL